MPAIVSTKEVSKYRQGSQIADFLICKNCGVMANVCYEENNTVYGSINIRSSIDYAKFGQAHVAHSIELSDQERINRSQKAPLCFLSRLICVVTTMETLIRYVWRSAVSGGAV